jgi:peptide/nickel transport system substrate-binding protein
VTRALAATLLAALVLIPAAGTHGIKEGGTFRVGMWSGFLPSGIDPAFFVSRHVHTATCAGLMRLTGKPAGLRLLPEVAADEPKITNGGRTYTFTIRKGVRFSTGAPVTGRSFAHTINRQLDPRMKSSRASDFSIIVGAQDVVDGKAATASGIVGRGNTLIIRLTKPVGDFLLQVAAPLFCVLPETAPIDPEGVKAPVPAAGPYFISEYVPGERVVLERNRFYRGDRQRHVDRFLVDLTLDPATILDRVERGELDLGFVLAKDFADRAAELKRKYGANRSRFFVRPGLGMAVFHLNTSRPLFRKNPKLRQALNFAVDRKAMTREQGPLAATATDQYLTPGQLGFRDERIYPFEPDLRRARALAEGHRRGGKAVLYTSTDANYLAQAQILQRNLKAIGIEVEIVKFPTAALFAKLDAGGEPYDIAWVGWILGTDPAITLGLFDGRTIGQLPNTNLSYFNSPKYNRLIEAASRLPAGPERYRAYGELDVDITKNAAPAIPYLNPNGFTFVGPRTGCVAFDQLLDLAAVCLK